MRIDDGEIVSLDFYNEQYREALAGYSLSKEQVIYSGLPMESVQDCRDDPDRHPIVILYHHKPAGFLVLHGRNGAKAYSRNPHAILLRAFSVNSLFQGRGIATKSLRILDAFIKKNDSETDEIVLAVNQKNIAARHVYRKAGYLDTGIRAMGRHGEMLILSKMIE